MINFKKMCFVNSIDQESGVVLYQKWILDTLVERANFWLRNTWTLGYVNVPNNQVDEWTSVVDGLPRSFGAVQ